MEIDLSNVLVVAGVAVLAPVLADLSRRARLPTVVAEIFLGILVGPELLGLAELDGFLDALSTFGLAFLFFLAGIEIDFERIRGAPARAGAVGWLLSLVLGAVVALALHLSGVIHATVLVALALTTTTLGTLMPILRDSGVLDQRFGRFVVGAGTAGEFGPIVLVSVILAFDADEPLRATLLFAFAAIVVVATRDRGAGAAGARRPPAADDDGDLRPARRAPVAAAGDRARGARGRVRPRRDPGRVRGRDPGRDRDPRQRGARVPRQARRGRLRLLDPGLLHHHRDGLRPRRARRRPGDAADGPRVHAAVPGRPRPAGDAALPQDAATPGPDRRWRCSRPRRCRCWWRSPRSASTLTRCGARSRSR